MAEDAAVEEGPVWTSAMKVAKRAVEAREAEADERIKKRFEASPLDDNYHGETVADGEGLGRQPEGGGDDDPDGWLPRVPRGVSGGPTVEEDDGDDLFDRSVLRDTGAGFRR